MTFREVKKILCADGWVLVRVAGSHYQFRKEGVRYTATVPNHSSRDLSKLVLKNLRKITGLPLRG